MVCAADRKKRCRKKRKCWGFYRQSNHANLAPYAADCGLAASASGLIDLCNDRSGWEGTNVCLSDTTIELGFSSGLDFYYVVWLL